MTIRLNGSSYGFTQIDAPSTAGDNTLVLPTGNGNADQALVTDGSGTLSFADRGRIVQGTAQASTSGTSIDFTGIPSWAKIITVIYSGVSTSGSDNFMLQIGDSGGIEATGYTATFTYTGPTSGGTASVTTGFEFDTAAAAAAVHGNARLLNLSGNTWVFTSTTVRTNDQYGFLAAGSKTLSGTLDRVRITTVGGTDTFDAGTINIMYEG